MDFLAVEPGLFHLDMPSTFPELFSPQQQGGGSSALQELVATRLATLCVSLNELPRIVVKKGCDARTLGLAGMVQSRLAEFEAASKACASPKREATWWYYGQAGSARGGERPRASLLLLDRADDPLSPLLHEFTYQAAVNDLLESRVDGQRIEVAAAAPLKGLPSGGGAPKKVAFLNEKDPMWTMYRHRHIATLPTELQVRAAPATTTLLLCCYAAAMATTAPPATGYYSPLLTTTHATAYNCLLLLTTTTT